LVFQNAVQRLAQAAIPEPELEVSLLLAHVLQIPRTAVLLSGEKDLDEELLAVLEECISRRLAREPLAYITGSKEFWSLDFMVSKDVLIPRPETEFLLEKALAVLKSPAGSWGQKVRILDLGTGSGVIAVVLAREIGAARVTAVDYSYKALKVAGHNAKKHGVSDRIDFINCDWFAGIAPEAEFDAVVSNPPYVGQEILAKVLDEDHGALQPEVYGFEPHLALDGGERGVREICRIAVELAGVLKPGGCFFMEIGADQREEVLDIFKRTGAYSSIAVFDDYAGRPRVLQARKS